MQRWLRLRSSRQFDGASARVWIVLLALGTALVLLGLFWEGTWEDVSIEIGAAAVVGGVVVFFKPRLMKQVRTQAKEEATTIASALVMTATEELTSRVVRLENVGDVQANVQANLQENAEQAISAVVEEVSQQNIERQLIIASEQGLFSDRILVKTNRDPGFPLIEVQRDELDVPGSDIRLTIWDLIESEDYGEYFDEKIDGDITWQPSDDPSDIVQKIVLKYKQLSMSEHDLMTDLLFDQLQKSYCLMVEAQKEPRDSHKRIRGKLTFLINDEWVLTDHGLEGTNSSHIFQWGGQYNQETHILLDKGLSCPEGCHEKLWKEAVYYSMRLDQFAP